MKLNRVHIKNFRSIREVEVSFDPPCRVLVGINESGKSNILRALRLLGDNFNPVKKDDLRDALPSENSVTEAFVKFIFKLQKEESAELLEQVSAKILSIDANPALVTTKGGVLAVKEFCGSRDEVLYTADIIAESKVMSYWRLPDNYKLVDGWKRPTAVCPVEFTVEIAGKQHALAQYTLIWTPDFPDVPTGYLENATIGDLSKLAGNIAVQITTGNSPDVLFWEYSETNLLPNSVNITNFAADPNTCPPLKNMFTLAGIQDVKASLEDAKKGTDNQFQNYLDRIADKTSAHFHKVWKEYNVEFSLRANADSIVPGIKEKNTHDFARRSDGFKRFITFLLMISINVETDDIQDTLLLIDEPDASLHPSGARYLRDELIRISRKNYVVYSTHSIFMIDSGEIGRHYIVRKNDEITTIEPAGPSNVADEEVLYNALGHSVFAILKEKNVIFEGWRDKHLFQVYLGGASEALKKKYENVGMCHAKGVKNIAAITPMIELAKRDCLIISDSDKPAKEQQKFYQKEKGYGNWKIYQDIDASIEAVTGEDFLKNEFIAMQVNQFLDGSGMPTFDPTGLPDKKDKLLAIKKWLVTNGMTDPQADEQVSDIKGVLFTNLTSQDIEEDYSRLVKGVSL